MDTRERVVHFYDVLLKSSTRAKDIPNPSCAGLADILARFASLRPAGKPLHNGKAVMIELADWRIDPSTGLVLALVNRADRDVSDVTFKDFNTRSSRKGGKTKTEGIENSCHVLIQPNSDGRSALMLMTMGAGVSFQYVSRMLNEFARQLSKAGHDDLFEFPLPSGERDSKGKPLTYRVRYAFECVAHKSTVLDDAVKGGRFVSMDLISHGISAFDAGGNLQIEERVLSIKEARPGYVTGAKLKRAVADFLKGKKVAEFDDLRIRYKSATGPTRTATLAVRDLDQAFTRKELITFDVDVEAQQTRLSPTVVAAMKTLL